MSAFVIGVTSWVVVRDRTSAYDGVHGTVVAIEGETARVRTDLGYIEVPFSILRIPVDGTDPATKALSAEIDAELQVLAARFDVAVARAAVDAGKGFPGLPPAIVTVLEILAKVLVL